MSVLSQVSVGGQDRPDYCRVSEQNEHKEVPTGAKEETVNNCFEPVTGASATAVTPDVLPATVDVNDSYPFCQGHTSMAAADTQAGEVPNHQDKPPYILAR